MKKFKEMALILIGLLSAGAVNAQDELEASVSADIVSNYIWRGGKLDESAVQPSLGFGYKGLSLSAWGSYGLQSEPLKELDLTLAYKIGGLNIGVTDYWSTAGADRYFMYEAHRTNHVFEANVGYDFGPVSLQWYTNFAGADARDPETGKRAYLSYVEANIPFTFGGLDWNAAVGAVPYSADTQFYDTNSKDFAVTNISLKASKDIKITESFSVPMFAQITANPSSQKAYMVVGVTLHP